jgi:hypothetical protein
MGVISRKWGNLRWGIIFLSGAVLMTCWLFRAGQSGRADESKSFYIRDMQLGRAHPDTLYAHFAMPAT